MIWLCGDTHGLMHLDQVEEFFDVEKRKQRITKADYLIILGDAGIVLDGGSDDMTCEDFYRALPCSTLFIDGNHENFDLLEKYPVTENWHGGKVQHIAPGIIHLMRGQVYNLQEHTFFTMGGGYSIPGSTKMIGWWKQEMPTDEEYQEGTKNLRAHQMKVDYILAHTCPLEIASQLSYGELKPGEERLQEYLSDIARQTEFEGFYFGHWHRDLTINEKYHCLFENIAELPASTKE